jgi:outer membrane protein TolC
MNHRSLEGWGLVAAGALSLSAVAGPAAALQPLEAFVTAAQSKNLDNREARATTDQREEEARQAWSRIGPNVVARASYTRNQVNAVLPAGSLGLGSAPITIVPYDQLDATFTLNVPLVDVGSWQRIGASAATADAARVRAQATGLDVEKSVIAGYYQVVAAEATLVAAEKALATAKDSQAITATRREAGTASELDGERAQAQVERARQVVAGAEQARALARRALASLTGLLPGEGTVPLPGDGLGGEPALEALEPGTASLPSVRAAALDAKAADKTAGAAWAALAPTLAASGTEHLTNATSFPGQVATAQAMITATWTLDPSQYFGAKAQSAAHAIAVVRERRAEQVARDTLHRSWQAARADVARARAARAEAEANDRAVKLARERYAVGEATLLDVQQAERDWLNSEVARIQAFADLAYARAAVRIDSGRQR